MPIPAKIIYGKKNFIVLGTSLLPPLDPTSTNYSLENNPLEMNTLSYKLGLSSSLEFYDIYSLTDLVLLSLIPRPVLALLVIIPITPA